MALWLKNFETPGLHQRKQQISQVPIIVESLLNYDSLVEDGMEVLDKAAAGSFRSVGG